MTSRYGRQVELGLSIVPASADLELARRADELGLELLGVQDHPYQWRFLESWSLIGDLLARTERIRAVEGKRGTATRREDAFGSPALAESD